MLALAPMQGLTELPFRKAYCQTFGTAIDFAVSPFISLTHGKLGTSLRKLADVLPENNINSIPLVPQILGSEIPEFIDVANRLGDLGYSEVNWNIGCPMPRVARKKRGSGILPYPTLVENVLEQVLTKTKTKISLKMRLGYSDENEILKLVPILNTFPIESITIHPRVGIELYDSDLHLDFLKQILPTIKHKVVFNGEIRTLDDYANIKTQFPEIEDFMIGRGAIINPTLPLEIKGEQTVDKKKLKLLFFNALCKEISLLLTPDKSKENKLKEYWRLMLQGIDGLDETTLNAPLYCTSFSDTRKAIEAVMRG